MACGCTAMVPALSGSEEYAIDEVNSLVVDSFDEEECFARLSALISDEKRLKVMQGNGLLTAADYSVRKAAMSELALIGNSLNEHRKGCPSSGSGARSFGSPKKLEQPSLKTSITHVPKLPITALVITWDVGHNPVGRSYMLAEVLDRVVRNVVIIGFQFQR